MVSKLFVLNIAELCTKNHQTEDRESFSTKYKATKIFVQKENALKKAFKGVSLDSLAVGEKSMITKINYIKGYFATVHQHPHEQCGYVISGEYRLKVETPIQKIDVLLHAGDSYEIPGNTSHSLEVIIGGEIVDVFTLYREDYL